MMPPHPSASPLSQKRKAGKLEKALAISGRSETKVIKRSMASGAKKATKALWLTDKAKR